MHYDWPDQDSLVWLYAAKAEIILEHKTSPYYILSKRESTVFHSCNTTVFPNMLYII